MRLPSADHTGFDTARSSDAVRMRGAVGCGMLAGTTASLFNP